MLEIDEISIVAGRLIVLNGSCPNADRLTPKDCRLQSNNIQLRVEKVVSNCRPRSNSHSIESRDVVKDFIVICEIDSKIQILENDFTFHALGNVHESFPVYQYSVDSYLAKIYLSLIHI